MEPATILLGVDFSPACADALEEAIRVAKNWKARLELVHAIEPLGAPGLDLSHPQFQAVRNESADVAISNPEIAQEWVARAQAAGIPTNLVGRAGSPADVILKEARRVDARAIVVGSRGRSPEGTGIIGSVAQKVLERSSVPVLVVPPATSTP
jgi:nucleotide-binding universal stress UspA family protein